jgi:demethylmenaquinone methyltransferase/2-methoxy-6-polyprenyl-1,4-benzoquinol methylase
MFDGIADRYDLLNGLLSFGLDRRWRVAAARAVEPGVWCGGRVLDLGCGTGELALTVARRATWATVTGVDLSPGMLGLARRRIADSRHARVITLVRGSAFALPFADAAFRAAVSGFVLRNIDGLAEAFTELARVVRPGGRIALVDVTEPPNPVLRRVFDAYFGAAAPALGALAGRREAYRYLVRSLAQLPPPAEVCRLLTLAGFDQAAARPLTGGIVTLFTAVRATEEAASHA